MVDRLKIKDGVVIGGRNKNSDKKVFKKNIIITCCVTISTKDFFER